MIISGSGQKRWLSTEKREMSDEGKLKVHCRVVKKCQAAWNVKNPPYKGYLVGLVFMSK